MNVSESIERTSRRIVAGTWAGAGIVMATNAAHSVAIFGALGGNRLVGLGVGVAVDVALCVGLIGDRHLAQHSQVSRWGRALRLTAGAVSMVIAVGGALITSHPFLALLLGFLPVVLWLLTEYGQDVLSKFTNLAQSVTCDEHDMALAAARQEATRVAAELDTTRREIATQRDAARRELANATHTLRQERDALARRIAQLASQHDKRDTPEQDTTSTPAQRRAWVEQQIESGRAVTGADVHRQFPNAPRDGARIVRQVLASRSNGHPLPVGSAA